MSTSKNRRQILWQKFSKSPKNWLALCGATFFGSGLLPKAPGTWGTLAAIPLWYLTHDLPFFQRFSILLTLCIWGVWSSRVFDQVNETQDNQNIVMDEVTGVGITAWTAGAHPLNYLVAFIVFRAFDIAKPFPVKAVDRWSHRSGNRWSAAFGVMADDWVAGIQGLGVLVILQYWGFLPK
ncbi:MAG: phosphatidylglycerophosphatase A [Bdellovibrionales bacterium]|nr:phosphatidylglycerophosphatase A [Bdellovibrionales bacterium]